MGHLVAVLAHGTTGFVEALRRAWDAGDAVVPVDPRLPAPARECLLRSVRPAVLIDPTDGTEAALEGASPPMADGDALVVATSGTTGEPKGMVLTYDALLAHARSVHAQLGVTASDRWLACLPLAHVGGLGVVVRAVLDGIGLDVHHGFDADAVGAAQRAGCTLTSLVPTGLDRLGADGWRWIVLGGSADPVTDRPANVIRTWGLTETGGGVVYDGRPLPGVEVIAAVEGDLWVRSPTLTRGLRRADGTVVDHRRTRSDDPTSAGWLPTGDGGEVGVDGTVTVHGRLDDMIVTGGENVWPEAVEAVLRRHPAVAEVAVTGRPDPEWGQRVVACVVPTPDAAGPPSLAMLRNQVRAELPAWCAPREIHLVGALPRTPSGKVRRSDLLPGG